MQPSSRTCITTKKLFNINIRIFDKRLQQHSNRKNIFSNKTDLDVKKPERHRSTNKLFSVT